MRRPADRPGARRPTAQVSLVLGLVAVLVGVGVVDHAVSTPAPPAPTVQPVSSVPAAGVESSAWYCAGGSGGSGSVAVATLDLVNTTDRRVTGLLTVVTDRVGSRTSRAVSVPARSEAVVTPSDIVSGTWVATSVQMEGGGVLVTQSVAGPEGWSAAPCTRATATNWYFASGTTNDSNALDLSLFNPTTTTAVVDLSFITPRGILAPQPFEGVVVPAGGLTVEQIGSYVQDQSSVSTVVHARAGRVVADEVETASATGLRGLSLRLGVPAPARVWALPRSVNAAGGGTTVSIFNPTLLPERVVVAVRLTSGPVTPFKTTLLGQSTWVLDAGAQVRIPKGVSYSSVVTASGAGVVVDRRVESSGTAADPQFGAQTAVPAGDSAATQIVAAPGTRAHPAVAGAAPTGIGLVNLSTGRVSVTVSAYLGPRGRGAQVLRRVVVGPSSFTLITGPLRGVHQPLVLRADGPVLALVDMGPAGSAGVVSLPAEPVEVQP